MVWSGGTMDGAHAQHSCLLCVWQLALLCSAFANYGLENRYGMDRNPRVVKWIGVLSSLLCSADWCSLDPAMFGLV
jgi:hypothetical protein